MLSPPILITPSFISYHSFDDHKKPHMNLCHIPSPMSNNNNIGSAINSHSDNNDINAAHVSNYPNYPNISHINWADIDCTDIEKQFKTN